MNLMATNDCAAVNDRALLTVRPVLYLDWDGVINFYGSRNQYSKRSGFSYMRRGSAYDLINHHDPNSFVDYSRGSFPLNWSAELLKKLAALPVEIVILSTWRHSFVKLVEATQWELENYRVLDWEDGPKDREHSGKIDALLADQLANPRPFIWADDEAHEFYTDEHRALLSHVPQLLLAPDENIGLKLSDYELILRFLEGLSATEELAPEASTESCTELSSTDSSS